MDRDRRHDQQGDGDEGNRQHRPTEGLDDRSGEGRAFPVCSSELAQDIGASGDLARLPVIRDRGAMLDWQLWLEPYGPDEDLLGDGPVFSDASLCLDAAIAGQGVFLAWDTLACDALASGRLVAPFPDRRPTVFACWYVTGRFAARSRTLRDFDGWLRRELEA